MIFIYLNEGVSIPLEQISLHQVLYASLKRKYTYKNPKFLENAKYGYSNHATPEYLYSFKINGKSITFSYGTFRDIVLQCEKLNVEYTTIDNTVILPQVEFPDTNITLRTEQSAFLRDMMAYTNGVGHAYCSFGKSVVGLEMIRRYKQPSMILVHTDFLLEQWYQEAVNLFGYTKEMIGGVGGKRFGGSKRKLGVLNICLYHSMSNDKHLNFFNGKIGLILHDEVQKAPIEAVQKVVNKINCRYKYGLTADSGRKDGKQFLTYDSFGKITAEAENKASDSKIPAKIVFSHTRFMSTESDYTQLITEIALDKERNIFLCKKALHYVRQGKQVIIFVERKEQAGILARMLKKFKVDMVIGPINKKVITRQDKHGKYLVHKDVREILLNYDDKTAFDRVKSLAGSRLLNIVIGTSKAEVGMSIRTFDVALVSVLAGANHRRLEQIRGRVERTHSSEQEAKFGIKETPIVDVIVDPIPMCYNAKDKVKEYILTDEYKKNKIKKDVIIRKKGEKKC